MNINLKLLLQIVVNVYRGYREHEYDSEGLQSSVKHSEGLSWFQGCVSASGVGNLVKIFEIMNVIKY